MSNVLIVGAGASRAEAISLGLTGTTLPPLDTDFFHLAGAHAFPNHLDRVKTYLKDNYSIDLHDGDSVRMEEAFGLVFSDTLTEPMPKGSKLAFSALCRIYNRVIASTTNNMKVLPIGPLATLISNISKAGPLTIVTFNQDLIVEKAMNALGKVNNNIMWYPDNGYDMNFANVTSPSNSTMNLFDISNGKMTSVKILKMHGSLNWYARTTDKEKVPSKLASSLSIHCTRRVNLSPDMTYTSDLKIGRKTWYTWPIIVPPIFEKGSFIGKALSGVWNSCFEAIGNAKHIYVYGYSFPNSDQQSEVFFKRATISKAISRTVSVINTDFASAKRANEILKPSAMITSTTVKKYFSSIRIF